MNRFIILDEITSECEWEFYANSEGEVCKNEATKAIVDTEDPYQSHIGHLCRKHIDKAFEGLNDE
jgi:hypothetical protein